MLKVFITPETKSEAEPYPMVKITNNEDYAITITEVSTNPQEIGAKFQPLVGLSIAPHSYFRFYVFGETLTNPILDEFVLDVRFTGRSSAYVPDHTSQRVNFNFLKLFVDIKTPFLDDKKLDTYRETISQSLAKTQRELNAVASMAVSIFEKYAARDIKNKLDSAETLKPLSKEELAEDIKQTIRDIREVKHFRDLAQN